MLVTNEQTNIKEELLIKRDRAIMEGNIKVSNTFFESLPTQLANKSEKPAKNHPKTRSEPFKNRCRKRLAFQH